MIIYSLILFPLQVVATEEGIALAKEYNIHFYETSAKQDINVENAFRTIATDVKNRLVVDGDRTAGQSAGGHRLGAANHQSKQSGGCCK